MHNVCPGARLFRQPKPEFFTCPSCGAEVEIWTDELKATCPNCKKTVYKDLSQSCVEWCKMAKECLSATVYDTYIKNRNMSIKKNLLQELKYFFKNDTTQIEHAQNVLKYAEKLLANENGDWHIVIPAAILHDIGIKVAREKYGSSTGEYHEKEGPPIARKILLKLGMKLEHIKEICEIISHHHSPNFINSNNFRILWDAKLLANFKIKIKTNDKSEIRKLINKTFHTDTAKRIASKIYL